MIKNLRKRHLQIWLLWAVLMPTAILFAWRAIPQNAPQQLLQKQENKSLPLIIQQWDKESYQVQLQSDQEKSHFQLEWKNKTVLIHPTATIYFSRKSPFQIDQSLLVGRIEARGTYHFPLDSTEQAWLSSRGKIVLYDFIHQQIIDTLNFIP